MNITTNNTPRALRIFDELPEEVRSDFDYIDVDAHHVARFFQYRGDWYDTHEFVRITLRARWRGGFDHPADPDSPLLHWQGIQTDTHSTGTLVRLTGDRVIVGRFSN
jgi:hypothetical protein